LSALLPLFVVAWLALAALIAAAAAAQLQPDAAPQADAPQARSVAPDPAPVASDPTPTPPAAAPPAPAAVVDQAAPPPAVRPPPVEPDPAEAPAPAPPARAAADPARRRENRTREARPRVAPQEGAAPRRQREAEDTRPAPDPLLQVDAILPGGQRGGDSPTGLLLIAAGALLALILASGSLVSVASRVSRGGLR
jgi:outer membrane biosynthesis protein TonB